MKVSVLYYSHKGKTANYAREIAMYLWSKGCTVSLSAISDYDMEKLQECDALVAGCWTCGWFVINQHPHRKWVERVKAVSCPLPENILLFTTYKFRVGGLFHRMRRALGWKGKVHTLSSKSGFLSVEDKLQLDNFVMEIRQSIGKKGQ